MMKKSAMTSCELCTYLNDRQSSSCAMCGSALTMDSTTVVPGKEEGSSVEDFGLKGDAADSNESGDPRCKPISASLQDEQSLQDAVIATQLLSDQYDEEEQEFVQEFREDFDESWQEVFKQPAPPLADSFASGDDCRESDQLGTAQAQLKSDDVAIFAHNQPAADKIAHDPRVAPPSDGFLRNQISGDDVLAAELQKAASNNDDVAYVEILLRNGVDTDLDAVIAAQIHEECANAEDLLQHHRKTEEHEMLASTSGRAWMFVEQVIRLAQTHGFDTLALDDMVVLAEGFVEKQIEFELLGKPTHAQVGYHNTKPEHLPSIQVHGLMSSGRRRLFFGDGLYTANNPDAFCKYGPRGLMCVILRGETQRITFGAGDRGDVDTGIGNKTVLNVNDLDLGPLFSDEYVLRCAEQCLPLISYDSSSTSMTAIHSTRLWDCHVALQKLLDEFFNAGVATVPQRITREGQTASTPPQFALTSTSRLPWIPPPYVPNNWTEVTAQIAKISYLAPSTLWCETADISTTYTLLSLLEWTENRQEACSLCFETYTKQTDAVKLVKCSHIFHLRCLETALSHSVRCPVCREKLVENQGKSPSGTMTISWSSLPCDGYESSTVGSFVIEYNLPGGIQKPYHDHPGSPYPPTRRKAFVPYTNEAWALVKRLTWVFQHGLTFTVGSSLTTGRGDVITWSSIHHKTRRCRGPHGFPDANYFVNVNSEMNALGVPSAKELPEVTSVTTGEVG